jgi:hypothetical protein
MVAEATHEIGRVGVLEAKAILERILTRAVDLPFNAYDNAEMLAFEDNSSYGGSGDKFLFDLGGTLRRGDPGRFARQVASPVFVEVKTRSSAGDALNEYREFLRRAAIVAQDARFRESWFLFYSTVPFGSSKAASIADGTFLREYATSWPTALQSRIADLSTRVGLVIATKSFVTLLTTWCRDGQ